MIFEKRITIIKVSRPIEHNLNCKLQWFGNTLGLFSERDKDKSCFRIFIELLKAAKERKPHSSDEIAERLGISRGTVIHHIRRLIEAGLVVHQKNRYQLRVDKLSTLVEEVHRDINRVYKNLHKVAEELDISLGL